MLVVNVGSLEKRSNQPKHKEQRTRSPKTTAKLILNKNISVVDEIECNRATVEPRYTKICQGTGKTYLFAILRFGPSPECFSTTGPTNTP